MKNVSTLMPVAVIAALLSFMYPTRAVAAGTGYSVSVVEGTLSMAKSTWLDASGRKCASIDIKDGAKVLHRMDFVVDPDTGSYTPIGKPEYVLSWATKAGESKLSNTLNHTAPGGTVPTVSTGTLAGLDPPVSVAYDGVTVIAASPPDEPGTVIVLLWNSGALVGASQSSGAGPWHPFCCWAFNFLCAGCDGAYEDCMDGGSNPCHAFDNCCWLAWFLARILHV